MFHPGHTSADGTLDSSPGVRVSGLFNRLGGRLEMKTDREPVSKQTRFNVFKRDGFQCQYCGQTPPTVILEIDHILAVANGGESSVDNLITACFDCNRGKAAGHLAVCPQTVQEKAVLLLEKREQLKAFERLQKAQRRWEEKKINEVEDAFCLYYPGYHFSPKFRTSVRIFIQKLDVNVVVDAMNRACVRIDERERVTPYFCGICWKTIKESVHG